MKRFSFLSWAIIISLLILGAYFVYGSLRIKQVQSDARNYSFASFCDDGDNCRTVVQARVLKSQTVDTSTISISISKYGSSSYRKVDDKRAYLVVFKPENLEKYEVVIMPNLEMETNSFGVSNVYFPVHQQNDTFDHFAERSIPSGVILNVEIWHDQLTLIYSKYVNSPYVANTLTFFDGFTTPTTKDAKTSEPVITYAIPTTDNPLVAYKIMRDGFDQSLAVIAFFPILFVVLKILSSKR